MPATASPSAQPPSRSCSPQPRSGCPTNTSTTSPTATASTTPAPGHGRPPSTCSSSLGNSSSSARRWPAPAWTGGASRAPPSGAPAPAARVAFGALMRQLHERLAHDVEDAPASPAVRSVPPVLEVVPGGAQLLPLIPRPMPTVTLEREDMQDGARTPELEAGTGEDADDERPEPPLMTSNDVARHYGIDPSTVRSWVQAGRLTVHNKDDRGRNLFHPDQLPRVSGSLVPSRSAVPS